MKELSVMVGAIREILHLTVEAFVNEDQKTAERVEPLEQVIDDLSDEMKMRHVDRLQLGKCTIANGFVFNDLITNFERLSDHCSNIALAIIEMHMDSFGAHEYIGKVKEKRTPDFMKNYEEFSARYSLN